MNERLNVEPPRAGLEHKRDSTISSSSSETTATTTATAATLPLQAEAHKSCRDESPMGRRGETRKWWRRTRMHVALLGLTIAAVNCYAQATFCIAIVEMVLPADYVGAAPGKKAQEVSQYAATGGGLAHQEDHSCPIEYKYRDYYDDWRFSTTTTTTTTTTSLLSGNSSEGATGAARHEPQKASSQTIDVSNRFDWDASQQGLLLGAFAVGTAPLQIAGGRLAEIYGSKWVLLAGCIGTGLANLAIPYLAHFSFPLLLVNRVAMGVAQAGMEPGLMCLLADWLTPDEAGFFISMLLFAICLGFFLGSLCSSFILGLNYGWPLAYYVSGGLNLLVALVWYLYADSWPRVSQHISEEELRFIEQEQARSGQQVVVAGTNKQALGSRPQDLNNTSNISTGELERQQDAVRRHTDLEGSKTTTTGGSVLEGALLGDPMGAPWRNILGSRPVWAFILCKISIRWCADVLSNMLPSYLASVLHLSIAVNGLLNSVSTALFAISSFLTGWLATSELCLGAPASGRSERETSLSKTRLRKSFQSLASFGSALCLILMAQFDCDLLVSTAMLLVLSCCLVMGTGGELQIPYDMTSRYPGTLHGLACSLSVSGWLAPPLIGLILGDQPSSRARWSLVWYSTAAINLLGGLVFVLFADASPRDFDKRRWASSSGAKRRQREFPEGRPQQQQVGAYVNGALSGSSCESSPKSSHPSRAPVAGCQAAKALSPLDAGLTFGCGEPIKCRHFESSFIQARGQLNCPTKFPHLRHHHADEPRDLIHGPRHERAANCSPDPGAANKQTSGERPPAWRGLLGLATGRGRARRPRRPRARSATIRAPLANEHPPPSSSPSPNERALANSETINHSGGSRDRPRWPGGAPNQLVDESRHEAATRPETRWPPHDLIPNAAAGPAAASVSRANRPAGQQDDELPRNQNSLSAPDARPNTITHL